MFIVHLTDSNFSIQFLKMSGMVPGPLRIAVLLVAAVLLGGAFQTEAKTECTDFAFNASSVQCMGLTRIHTNKSDRACFAACCVVGAAKCSTWQWLPDDGGLPSLATEDTGNASASTNPTPGCWIAAAGSVTECRPDSKRSWIGGSRTPLPSAAPPLPLPALLSEYVFDAAAIGAKFDGIGAISGGGGETVLLPAYPAVQQQQVLDYLFKPSFGAALHILKLEIGGESLQTMINSAI